MKYIKTVTIAFLFFLGNNYVNGQSQIPDDFMGLCGCCDSILPIKETGNSCTNHSSLFYFFY